MLKPGPAAWVTASASQLAWLGPSRQPAAEPAMPSPAREYRACRRAASHRVAAVPLLATFRRKVPRDLRSAAPRVRAQQALPSAAFRPRATALRPAGFRPESSPAPRAAELTRRACPSAVSHLAQAQSALQLATSLARQARQARRSAVCRPLEGPQAFPPAVSRLAPQER